MFFTKNMLLNVTVMGAPNVDTTVFGDETYCVNEVHVKFTPSTFIGGLLFGSEPEAILVLFDSTRPETRNQARALIDQMRESYGNEHPILMYDRNLLHAGNFDELMIPLIRIVCACDLD